MNNFFDILIQKFSNLINIYNKLLSNFFNKLNYKNFSILIVDKRELSQQLLLLFQLSHIFQHQLFINR